MTEWISSLTDWLGQHPDSLLLAIFIAAWIESMVLIGVLIPAVALLFATAALAGTAEIPIHLCLTAAALGASTGDILSFLLGRYAHPWLLRRWPFNRHQHWVDKGERFFSNYGLFAVIIGRFIGPIRPIIPFVAGMFSMRPVIFIPIDLITSVLWALGYILPGYYLGSSAISLTEINLIEHPAYLATLIMATAVLVLMVSFGIHWRYQPASLNKPQPPLLGIHGLATMVSFLLVTALVLSTDWHRPYEQALTHWLHVKQTDWLTVMMVAITTLGDGITVTIITATTLLWLWQKNQQKLMWTWLVCGVGVELITRTLKQATAIARPDLLAEPLSSMSFPSGHSSNFAVMATFLAIIGAQHFQYLHRWIVYGPAAVMMVLVATSRLYLGVHWLSDVIAGLLLGTGISALALQRLRSRGIEAEPGDYRFYLGLLIAAAACLALRLPGNLSLYQPL